jgi:hypothetical protein
MFKIIWPMSLKKIKPGKSKKYFILGKGYAIF